MLVAAKGVGVPFGKLTRGPLCPARQRTLRKAMCAILRAGGCGFSGFGIWPSGVARRAERGGCEPLRGLDRPETL